MSKKKFVETNKGTLFAFEKMYHKKLELVPDITDPPKQILYILLRAFRFIWFVATFLLC